MHQQIKRLIMSQGLSMCEYIWLDGNLPVHQVRSKSKVVKLPQTPDINDFPKWNFDGSSTGQAVGNNSDCLLQPVFFTHNPLGNPGDHLVLCEVMAYDGSEHNSNTRAQLRKVLESGGAKFAPWLGFEQEYTMFQEGVPLGWPKHGYPAPQGPYYCGVGAKQVFGRELAIEHANACLKAGFMYYGMNAEVMAGQWEFQVGFRDIATEPADALTVSDHVWVARWLLHRLSEKYGIHISFDNKPIKGDWNGAGMHTNFSTEAMRDIKSGKKSIKEAIESLQKKHAQHIALYGHKLEARLTGKHETASIEQFSYGYADRSSSIRIPRAVADKGYGYIEDRRPGANADPYLVAARLIATICGGSEQHIKFSQTSEKNKEQEMYA